MHRESASTASLGRDLVYFPGSCTSMIRDVWNCFFLEIHRFRVSRELDDQYIEGPYKVIYWTSKAMRESKTSIS